MTEVDRVSWRGMAGVVLLFFALGVPQLLFVAPTVPEDEPRHAGYALEVASGRLPLVTEPLPTERLGIPPLKRTNIMAAANHPPLYYALVGPFIRWGSETGHHELGLRLARAATLAMGAVGLIYAFVTIRLLVPNRPAAAVATVACVAAMPAFINVCALVHNDALAVMTASGFGYAVARWLVADDRSRRQLGVLSAWAAAVALTRFSGLLVLAPFIALLGLGTAYKAAGSWPRRLAQGAFPVVVVVAVVAVTSGWFYARNYVLYDDVTGGKALFGVLARKPHGTLWSALWAPAVWSGLHDHIWTRLAGSVHLGASVQAAGRLWTFLGVVGLVRYAIAAPRLVRAIPPRDLRAWTLAASAAAFGVIVLSVFAFYARGGNPTARYWFPMAWVPMLVVSLGWSGLHRRAGMAVGVVLSVVLSGHVLLLYANVLLAGGRVLRDFATVRAAGGGPTEWIAPIALLGVAVALVAVVDAILTLEATTSAGTGRTAA